MKQVLYFLSVVIFLSGNTFSASLGQIYNQPMTERYKRLNTDGMPLYNEFFSTEPGLTSLYNRLKLDGSDTRLYKNYVVIPSTNGGSIPLHSKPEQDTTPLYNKYFAIPSTSEPEPDSTPLYSNYFAIPSTSGGNSPVPDTTPLYGYWHANNLRFNQHRLTNTEMQPDLTDTPPYGSYESVGDGRPPLYGYWIESGDSEKNRAPLGPYNRYSPNTLPGPPLKDATQGADRQTGSTLDGILGSGIGSVLNPLLGEMGSALGQLLGPIMGSINNTLLRLTSESYDEPVVKHYDAYLVEFPEYGKYVVLTEPGKPYPFYTTKEGGEDENIATSAKSFGGNINDESYSVDNSKNLVVHQDVFEAQDAAKNEGTDKDVLIGAN